MCMLSPVTNTTHSSHIMAQVELKSGRVDRMPPNVLGLSQVVDKGSVRREGPLHRESMTLQLAWNTERLRLENENLELTADAARLRVMLEDHQRLDAILGEVRRAYASSL